MRNLLKKAPVLKLIGIAWIIFASLYVIYGEYQRLNVVVAQRAYSRGVSDSVNKLMQESQKCQPIPVTASGSTVELIPVDCLKGDEQPAE